MRIENIAKSRKVLARVSGTAKASTLKQNYFRDSEIVRHVDMT